jgi:hypothetical protein
VDLEALDMGGIDGASIDDLWVSISASGSLPGTTSTNAACHLACGAIDRCVGFPDTGATSRRSRSGRTAPSTRPIATRRFIATTAAP